MNGDIQIPIRCREHKSPRGGTLGILGEDVRVFSIKYSTRKGLLYYFSPEKLMRLVLLEV